jgi:hypothetical protein
MRTTLLILTLLTFHLSSSAQNIRKIRECLINEKGVLTEANVDYNTTTGEKTLTYNGKVVAFETLGESKAYAQLTPWFKNNEQITYKGKKFVKYGLPRVLGVTEIELSDKYKDVGVYIERGYAGKVEVIYIPVRPGCEFQPYQVFTPTCGTVTFKPSVAKVKPGKYVTITANVAGAKEKLEFKWTARVGTIVGSDKKNSVVVSSKDVPNAVDMSVKITGTECVSYEYVTVPVGN